MNAGEVRMVGTTLVVTLHVELVWTDLEDFAEHYKRALRGHEARDLLMQPPGLYWRLWGDEPCPEKLPFEGWDILGDTGRFVRVLPVPVGSTGMTYYVVQGTLGQEHRIMFAVSALRYRRDRLRVYLAENQQCEHHADGTIVTKWPQGAPVYGAAMLDWLLRNWGEDTDWLRFRFEAEAKDAGENALAERAAIDRPTVYGEKDTSTTLVHYLIEALGKTQTAACGLVRVAPKTYRQHRAKGKLLSEAEFRRRTHWPIEDAAQAVIEGKWYMG